MIDIHPPQHAPMTKREFFTHLFIVVLGILIAIGLEQTVEYLHHRHQVSETREALEVEHRQNLELVALETRVSVRRIPYLRTNLAVLAYIREHPHAPRSSWPGVLDWNFGTVPFNDAAWNVAQRDGVTAYMPQSEVENFTDLYSRLARIRDNEIEVRDAVSEAAGYLALTDDPSHLSSAELDKLIERATQVLVREKWLGDELYRLEARHHEFAISPADMQQLSVLGISETPQDQHDTELEHQAYLRLVKQQ